MSGRGSGLVRGEGRRDGGTEGGREGGRDGGTEEVPFWPQPIYVGASTSSSLQPSATRFYSILFVAVYSMPA